MADFSRFTGMSESSEVSRQLDPRREKASPAEKEQAPTYFERSKEIERSDSSWAGSSMGGGTWAGRTK
jgi:hypothetical protein